MTCNHNPFVAQPSCRRRCSSGSTSRTLSPRLSLFFLPIRTPLMIKRLLSSPSLALLTCSLMAQNAVAPAPVSLPSAPQLIQQGREAFRNGKWDAAAEKFQAAITQDSKSGEAFAGLSRTYLRQEKVQQALETATRGLEAAPDYVPGHSALGEVYFRQGLMNNAEKEFVKGANAS